MGIAVGAAVLAFLSYRAGRTVGWHARGYVEEFNLARVRDETRALVLQEVGAMLDEVQENGTCA